MVTFGINQWHGFSEHREGRRNDDVYKSLSYFVSLPELRESVHQASLGGTFPCILRILLAWIIPSCPDLEAALVSLCFSQARPEDQQPK